MYRKLKYLTKVSLKKKIATKWFLIVNLILAIAIISIVNIDQIIKFLGGDFDEKTNIVVIDETKKSFSYFKTNLLATSLTDEDDAIELTESMQTIEEVLEESPDAIVIELTLDDINYIKAKITSKSAIDALEYQQITQALMATKQQYALSLSSIDEKELAMVVAPLEISRVILENDKNETEDMSTIMGTVFPTLILPFFMLVIFLIQMIGTEINEEKTTRSMEIIISNVSPKVHFFSKVLASNIFVIVQGVLLFLYGAIAFAVRFFTSGESTTIMGSLSPIIERLNESGFIHQLVYIIPLTLILLILSFLAYALISGILASMTVNMEDFQQIQAPVIFLCLIAYYLSIMAGMFHGSLLIRILSYVPLISCLLSPALLVLGQVGIIDVIISIIILCLFNYVLVKFGMKIYKIGILNYSTDKMWSKLWKAVKSHEE